MLLRQDFQLAVLSTLLLVFTGNAHAVPTTIDFEAFTDGENLDGVNIGGVTLTAPASRVEVYDDRSGISYHSASKAIANLGDLANPVQDNPLTGIFDKPASYVSLWGGDVGFDTEQWSLEAFDAPSGGNSLGFVITPEWNGSPYEQLSISAPGIVRFEANHIGGFGIGYDDLSFELIPEPSAIVLGAIGLLCVGWYGWRRKRKAA